MNALTRAFSGGAAHAASRHWSAQRLTAIALVPLAIWFLVSLLLLPDMQYATVHTWVGRPSTATLLCLMTGALFWHSRLGVQVVVEDYVQQPFIHATLWLSTLLHLLAGAAAVLAVLRVAMGNA